MTGEPAHTASKEIRVTELMFSPEQAPQLSLTDSKVNSHYALLSAMFHYTVLQIKNNRTIRRSASAINPATTKNTDNSCTPTINY